VEDGAVIPLLYEERIPKPDITTKTIHRWPAHITEGLTNEQKTGLRKKFSFNAMDYQSDSRIELIAHDISDHFVKNIPDGMKGQLITDSKLSAIRYKKYLDNIGLVNSAVVISSPDTHEDCSETDDIPLPEIQQWWRDNIGNQGNDVYTKKIVRRFSGEDNPQLLIMVDKFLPDFDEPRNTVLYIDNLLENHSIIQAATSINQLHELKEYGFLIDYRGILKTLDTTLEMCQETCQETKTLTRSGFDTNDLAGLYQKTSTEYKKLPMFHEQLWELFREVKNRNDLEQFRQILIPLYKKDDNAGIFFDSRQKTREDFYKALRNFSRCLKVALGSASFYEDKNFTQEDIKICERDLTFFTNLQRITQQDAGETMNYSHNTVYIKKFADNPVANKNIREPDEIYRDNKPAQKDIPLKWTAEKIRNEINIISTRLKKTIEQELLNDPYAQKIFSEQLKEAIQEAEAEPGDPYKKYILFRNLENRIKNKIVPGMPGALINYPHAHAYYGVFRIFLKGGAFNIISDEENQVYIELSLMIDNVINKAEAEHSLNPYNIETEIRKKLLPPLFKRIGLEKTKKIIEQIIQITPSGLARKND